MNREVCLTFKKQLYDYAEGTLPKSPSLKLEKHLLSCSSCRNELDAVLEVEDALDSYPMLSEPIDLVDSIISEARNFPQRHLKFVISIMEVAFATVLATATSVLVWITLGATLTQDGEEFLRFDDALESIFGLTSQEFTQLLGQVLPWSALAVGPIITLFIIATLYNRRSVA